MLKASEARQQMKMKESGEYKLLFSVIENEINECVSNFKRKASIDVSSFCDSVIYEIRTLLFNAYGYTCSIEKGSQYNETYKILIIEW